MTVTKLKAIGYFKRRALQHAPTKLPASVRNASIKEYKTANIKQFHEAEKRSNL